MKRIRVHNPNNLPVIRYSELLDLQGDLKTLSESNLNKLKASIVKYGFFVPKFIWKSNGKHYILDGHQTVKACEALEVEGYEIPEIPYVEVKAKDRRDAGEKLLQINSRYGTINPDTTFFENFDIDLSFINEIEIPELNIDLEVDTSDIPEAQIDKAEELQEKWKVKRGDIWRVNKHRLMCGDSTKQENVEILCDGKKTQLVFTDPPYGVDYDGGTTVREKLSGNMSTDLYVPCCSMAYKYSDDKAALYLWHAGVKGIAAVAVAAAAVVAAGYEIRCEIIWNKNQAQFGALSAQYKQKHEPLYYCFKKNKIPRWFGLTNEVTVWDCDRVSVNEFHPTQKSPELACRAINNSSSKSDIVLDLFLGSGSTMVAAEKLDRICFGMEIYPPYVSVCLQRMSDMGLEPKLIK